MAQGSGLRAQGSGLRAQGSGLRAQGSGLRAQGELLSSHDLNNLKLLSVIIPAYNVEKFLVKCVDSVVNQSYKNIEIIIVDDGSTDNTPKICDELANKYNNIKVIHQANQGSSKARENGLNASIGEYIAFIDSDDYIDLNAYERVIKVLEENDCDMVMFEIRDVDMAGNILGIWQWPTVNLKSPQEIFKFFAETDTPTWGMPYKVYKRTIFENIEWPNISMAEDYFISAQLFAKAQKFASMSGVFYYYVRNPDSLVHIPYTNTQKLDDEMQAIDFVSKLTSDKFPEFLPEVLFHQLKIMQFILYKCSRSDAPNTRETIARVNHSMLETYSKMKLEFAKQNRKPPATFKDTVRNYLFACHPNIAFFYLKLRLKLHDLTGI